MGNQEYWYFWGCDCQAIIIRLGFSSWASTHFEWNRPHQPYNRTLEHGYNVKMKHFYLYTAKFNIFPSLVKVLYHACVDQNSPFWIRVETIPQRRNIQSRSDLLDIWRCRGISCASWDPRSKNCFKKEIPHLKISFRSGWSAIICISCVGRLLRPKS